MIHTMRRIGIREINAFSCVVFVIAEGLFISAPIIINKNNLFQRLF